MKEITLKLYVEEMSDWWSNNWGWWYSWKSIYDGIKKNWILKKSILEMKRSIQTNGFEVFLSRYTGIDQIHKDKIFKRKFGENWLTE